MLPDPILKTFRNMLESKSLFNKILSSESIAVKGLPGSLKIVFLSILITDTKRPILVVMPTRDEAESAADELVSVLGENAVLFYPEGEEDPESPIIINPRRAGMQMLAVQQLLNENPKMIVTSSLGICQRIPSQTFFQENRIVLQKDHHIDLYQLVEKLVDFGYTRESIAEKPGEISVRGGILDIFPYTGEAPHRVELFGDKIESLRTFEIETQRSIDHTQQLDLIPTPLAWSNRSGTFFSVMPKDTLLFLEDPELILGEIEKTQSPEQNHWMTADEVEQLLKAHTKISMHTLTTPERIIDLGGRPISSLGSRPQNIRQTLKAQTEKDNDVFILCQQEEIRPRIKNYLDLEENPISRVRVDLGSINHGFLLPDNNLAVYTDIDLLRRETRKDRHKRFREGIPIRELSCLKRGDFVVHADHGIGIYQGLEKITVGESERECLSIHYKDKDKLYVPVDKMERVQKYSGRDGFRPALHKLGSGGWEKVKAKTKKTIIDITKDLIALYSARKAQDGFSFSADSLWEKELEASFTFEETLDQARAIDEIRNDMQSSLPMDRLICGDVGFGKTEVAIRAAFKAVNNGKQVAMLVPTTILALQHYQTFQDRLSPFPVNIEMLSRFRTKKEQQSVVHRLKEGQVDIVIGTHRLVSKDVGFKDLGLLIIDEEQRFGVRHKERLKMFRKTVDVMSLSATPIPRTLHLSMMGIRDMSIINTPPRDRLPIITEVASFQESTIIKAIEGELARGGQIFFVHNRIKSIFAVERMIKRLVPGIRLAVAHGRMEEKALEKVMIDFVNRKYDCLVATMIIGSGLDMPRVNTLIVHRADQLGLSQLYQLRGRVGRSDRRAYAYLLTQPFHHLTQDAIRRLRTIEEFTELGSGFQIALCDLEIRGTGNLLGVKQSGKIDAVGFDMYTRLVNEAVEEIKAEESVSEEKILSFESCKVDTDLPAFIPESYVSEESIRVNLYRKLSSSQTLKDIDILIEELLDRFGSIPQEAHNLLDVARMRILGDKSGLEKIVHHGNTLQVFFSEQYVKQFPSSELFSKRLRTIIDSSHIPVRFLQKKGFGLQVLLPQGEPLSFTKKWLQSWS